MKADHEIEGLLKFSRSKILRKLKKKNRQRVQVPFVAEPFHDKFYKFHFKRHNRKHSVSSLRNRRYFEKWRKNENSSAPFVGKILESTEPPPPSP